MPERQGAIIYVDTQMWPLTSSGVGSSLFLGTNHEHHFDMVARYPADQQ